MHVQLLPEQALEERELDLERVVAAVRPLGDRRTGLGAQPAATGIRIAVTRGRA